MLTSWQIATVTVTYCVSGGGGCCALQLLFLTLSLPSIDKRMLESFVRLERTLLR
jgi:hypothetical protein